MAEDAGTGSLVRADHGNCTCDDDENVEDHAERCHTDDDGCDGNVDLPKIAGEGTTEKQQCNLQHQRQCLHHVVEVPGDDPVQFPLSVLTAFDGRPSHVSRHVSIQPLLAEHRKEGGEQRSSETREEDRLDVDYCAGGAGPLWECRNIVSEGGVIDLVKKNAEESSGDVVRVLLDVGVDLDDERGGNGGEQTGLYTSQHAHT
jgi:hypothetical protein